MAGSGRRGGRSKRGLALVGVLTALLAAGAAAAGKEVTRVELAFFEHGAAEPVNRATLWIAERRVRIEQHAAADRAPRPTLIYRGDENRVLSVADASRSYVELGGRMLSALTRAEGEAAPSSARRALDAQLEGLPNDQRRALERLLGVARRDGDANARPVVVERLGGAGEVAGFRCERVVLVRGEATVGEACIAPWDRLGLAIDDLETLRALANFQREALGARGVTPLEFVPNQPYDLIAQFDGLPLSFRRTVDARERSAIRVESIEAIDLSPDLFDAPADYARRSDPRAFLPPRLASALSGRFAGALGMAAPPGSAPARPSAPAPPATSPPAAPAATPAASPPAALSAPPAASPPAAPAPFAESAPGDVAESRAGRRRPDPETPAARVPTPRPVPAAHAGASVSTRPRLPIRLRP